ncbi:hypothetical protein L208DRAFT_1385358 [Tricholoma matsutake]|nr:hypothetical protein L208DRAFT_1385358 [Tricholoma matsutake 945]
MPANTSKVIHIGDVVSAKAPEEAERIEEINLKDPPKVVFKEQYGHTVSHNPETHVHGDDHRK